MPEKDLKIADFLVGEAKNDIARYTDQRGDLYNNFTMIAQLWSIYLINVNVSRHNNPPAQIFLDARDIAEMMSLMAKAKKIYDGLKGPERHVEDLTYAALAGEIALKDTDGDPFLKDKATAPGPSYRRPHSEEELAASFGAAPRVKPT